MSYTLTKRENLSLTLIQTNAGWIDEAFNLVCILKEWEFPSTMREFPKKGRQMYLKWDHSQLGQIIFNLCVQLVGVFSFLEGF